VGIRFGDPARKGKETQAMITLPLFLIFMGLLWAGMKLAIREECLHG
jgi:hypothetical protein